MRKSIWLLATVVVVMGAACELDSEDATDLPTAADLGDGAGRAEVTAAADGTIEVRFCHWIDHPTIPMMAKVVAPDGTHRMQQSVSDQPGRYCTPTLRGPQGATWKRRFNVSDCTQVPGTNTATCSPGALILGGDFRCNTSGCVRL
jgi:hypothetical protein